MTDEIMDEIICDRCGKRMNTRWRIDGMEGYGGNCACCGDDLCASCAGGWNDEGECMECRKIEARKLLDGVMKAGKEQIIRAGRQT